jgi:hypothetical protein
MKLEGFADSLERLFLIAVLPRRIHVMRSFYHIHADRPALIPLTDTRNCRYVPQRRQDKPQLIPYDQSDDDTNPPVPRIHDLFTTDHLQFPNPSTATRLQLLVVAHATNIGILLLAEWSRPSNLPTEHGDDGAANCKRR